MASKSVFLSYARSESRSYAANLERVLAERGIDAFLDTTDIALGEQFLGPMVDALLGARVVVLFLGPVYFTRPGCLRELEVAQAVHNLEMAADREGTETAASRLRHVIAVLPPGGNMDLLYDHLAWAQAQTDWTTADDTGRLAKLVSDRLVQVKKPLRSRLSEVDAASVREHAVRMLGIRDPPAEWSADERRWYHPTTARPLSLGDHFIGRTEELFRLRNLLSGRKNGAHEPIGVVVSGRPGGGKTRLVEEYVSHFGHEWAAAFWIDASSDAVGLARQQYEVGRRVWRFVHGDGEDPPTMADLQTNGLSPVEFLADVLDRVPKDMRFLVVLDNVPEGGARKEPFRIESYCPILRPLAVVLTRRQEWQSPGFGSLVIKELAPTAAVVLLTRGVARRDILDYPQWQEIAGWVGYLPLALILLNAAMAPADDEGGGHASAAAEPLGGSRGLLDPRELLGCVHRPATDPTPAFEPLTEQLPRELLGAVLGAFALSFERLDSETQAAASLLAYFGSSHIPTVAIEALSFPPATRCLAALHQRHFLRDVVRGPVTIEGSMHRLLAEYLRLRSNSPQCATEVCAALLRVHNGHFANNPANWPLLDACFEHVRSIVAWRPAGDMEGLDAANALAKKQVRTGASYSLLLEAQGRLSAARAWTDHMYHRAVRVLGASNAFTILLAAQLADLHRKAGDETAATTVAGEAWSATHDETSSRPVIRGLAAITAADYGVAEAKRVASDAVSSMPLPARLIHRSLAASRRAATEPEPALEELEQIIAESAAAYGPDAVSTLKLREIYAGTLADTSHADAALREQEQVVASMKALLGAGDLQTAESLLSLGSLYARAGDLAAARAVQRRALQTRRRLLKRDHPDTLKAIAELAFTVAMQNQHPRANRMYSSLVAHGRRVLGESNPLTLEWAGWQAWELARSGDHAQAAAVRRVTIRAAEPSLGPDHPALLELKTGLLKDLQQQQAHGDAYEVALTLVENTRRIHGEQSREALRAMEAAANCGLKASAAGAVELLRGVYGLGLQLYGPEHKGVQRIKARLEASDGTVNPASGT